MKSKSVRWAGLVVRMAEKYIVLVLNMKEGVHCEDISLNIRLILKRIVKK